ncbi:uncharacterized protein LOC125326609 isoform X4 [Corvus hawaiiensis]|uniref:uncharacterized protein LOC116444453 isoform X5 n=1 Tax=Corvus moneduloides TaxID=1196302 RepID=UPI0013620DE8|nr:uncharacterized protein LOC116444453 isoform X5 [Corvus moneduloides]XP_041907879.1 uncharacterized protein LOC121676032 isoform X4 [Corvus kubaryi]XP_048161019.1 uncharacterized protein LOC125326609 isoform X4 [Corvus hawaiiensis]
MPAGPVPLQEEPFSRPWKALAQLASLCVRGFMWQSEQNGSVNVLIVASIVSCVAILIVIVYSSFTLKYGEEEELSSAPVHVIHTRFVLNKVVKGANIAMLAVSICSAFFVLAMAYLGCLSLPRCSCYDSVTGMEWLQPSEDQNQTVEMVCAVQSPGGRIFNFRDRFLAQDVDAEEDTSKPPPYIRMT